MTDLVPISIKIDVDLFDHISPVELVPHHPIEFSETVEIAPLVSAENILFDNKICLKLRIIVYVADCYKPPKIAVANSYSTFYIIEDGKEVQTAVNYKMWLFNLEHETSLPVNQVTVFNTLTDPKTSRGTVTTVQSTMPPSLV